MIASKLRKQSNSFQYKSKRRRHRVAMNKICLNQGYQARSLPDVFVQPGLVKKTQTIMLIKNKLNIIYEHI